MTIMFYDSIEAEQNFNSDIWVDVASKTGILNFNDYWLWFSCEYGGTLTNREVEIRITLNDVEHAYDYHTPEKSNGYKTFAILGQISPLADDTSYTIKLQVRGESSSQTVNVRRIRLMVMQK